MNFGNWFSRRLRLGKGAPSSTTTGVVIAIAGVALALAVMELSLAVSSGFKQAIEQRVLGFDAPVTVEPAYDYYTATSAETMQADSRLTAVISSALPEARIVPSMRRHAMLKTDNDFIAVECLARGAAHDAAFELGNMTEGSLPDFAAGGDSIVISSVMASQLGIGVGDRVFLYFFVNEEPKARRATVAGLYQSNFGEYDRHIAYAPLDMMQRLGGGDSITASSIELEGIPLEGINEATTQLQAALVDAYRAEKVDAIYPVTNIFRTGAQFFNWLDLLDTNVVVIFILMTCIAALTLISSLFIIILDRVPTIGILRALGADRRAVSNIFVRLAMRLVGVGMIIGNALTLGIIYLQQATHIMRLDPQMYYLAYVPFSLSWATILWLNLGVAAGAWLILILPARLASRIDPAATMRYQ